MKRFFDSWMIKCCLSRAILWNFFWHLGHLNGHSPVWVLLCSFKRYLKRIILYFYFWVITIFEWTLTCSKIFYCKTCICMFHVRPVGGNEQWRGTSWFLGRWTSWSIPGKCICSGLNLFHHQTSEIKVGLSACDPCSFNEYLYFFRSGILHSGNTAYTFPRTFLSFASWLWFIQKGFSSFSLGNQQSIVL